MPYNSMGIVIQSPSRERSEMRVNLLKHHKLKRKTYKQSPTTYLGTRAKAGLCLPISRILGPDGEIITLLIQSPIDPIKW